jgi:hypothetical protein
MMFIMLMLMLSYPELLLNFLSNMKLSLEYIWHLELCLQEEQ